MGNNDWQLDAVHEQFDVFDKLIEPHSTFAATDLKEIIKKVDFVLTQQWRVKSKPTNGSRNISAELIKALPEQEKSIHISYTVVVTDEAFGDKLLCKIPVFIVRVGKQNTFVDVSCSVYKSWDAFMKNNDLPACNFCYPVNGCYAFGGKLKIDFAPSPAAITSDRHFWLFTGCIVVGVAVTAATFFFNFPPIAFQVAGQLIPLARSFLPTIYADALRKFEEIALLGKNYRRGQLSVAVITLTVFRLLSQFYFQYKEEIHNVWKEIKKKLFAAYDYLWKIFAKYFKRASDESQHKFFANVIKVENEMTKAVEEAGVQISEMQDDLVSSKSPIATVSTVMVRSYNQQIFENCRNESALKHEIKTQEQNNGSQAQLHSLKPTTQNLLIQCDTVANTSNVKTLSDVNNIFESLSCVVKDEYKKKINNYIKGVEAAQAGAENGINLNVYNKCLGIVGDPKDHYMKEAMETMAESRLAYRLKEKIKEFRMDTQIFLIPMFKKSEEEEMGVYKAIGARGNGKFSAQMLVRVLKESFNSLAESSLVVNETNSVIFIRSEDMSIFAYQEVNIENTSEGVVYVNKN